MMRDVHVSMFLDCASISERGGGMGDAPKMPNGRMPNGRNDIHAVQCN